MAFIFNGLSAEVTISGALDTNIPDMPTGATRLVKAYGVNGTADTPVAFFTPTALKTIYITDMVVYNGTGVTTYIRFGDNIAGAAYTAATAYDKCTIFALAAATSFRVHFTTPMIVATALKGTAANNGNLTCAISGWEI